jgi:hypothetical protein
MMPMAQFMGDRKPLSSWRGLGIDRDDRAIASSDDPCFARMQVPELDPGPKLPGDRLEINLFGPVYPKILQNLLRESEATAHD